MELPNRQQYRASRKYGQDRPARNLGKEFHHGGTNIQPEGVSQQEAERNIEMAKPDHSVVSDSIDRRIRSSIRNFKPDKIQAMIRDLRRLVSGENRRLIQIERILQEDPSLWKREYMRNRDLWSNDYDRDVTQRLQQFEILLNREQATQEDLREYLTLRRKLIQWNEGLLAIYRDELESGPSVPELPIQNWQREPGEGQISYTRKEQWKSLSSAELIQQIEDYQLKEQALKIAYYRDEPIDARYFTSDNHLRERYVRALEAGQDVTDLEEEYRQWLNQAIVIVQMILQERGDDQPTDQTV